MAIQSIFLPTLQFKVSKTMPLGEQFGNGKFPRPTSSRFNLYDFCALALPTGFSNLLILMLFQLSVPI